jgi:hypothetical protein
MKKLTLLLLIASFACCTSHCQIKPAPNIDTTVYTDSIKILKDSIVKISQKQTITADQFIKLYKYDRLYKYYQICHKNPSQWKFYKGWSMRVFNQ